MATRAEIAAAQDAARPDGYWRHPDYANLWVHGDWIEPDTHRLCWRCGLYRRLDAYADSAPDGTTSAKHSDTWCRTCRAEKACVDAVLAAYWSDRKRREAAQCP